MPGLRTILGDLRHALAFAALRSFWFYGIKVRGVLGMTDMWNMIRLYSANHQPIDCAKESMILDVVHAAKTKPLVGARAKL